MAPSTIALLITAPAWRGSGTSFAKIAAGLAQAGYRPVVLTAAAAVTARLVELGLDVHQLTVRRTGWREVQNLARVLGSLPASLIVADAPRDVRLATLATLPRRLPLIFRYNLSGRSLPADPVSRFLQHRITALVYQSDYARERALRTSPWLARLPSHRIPNGYDAAELVPDPAAGRAFRRMHGIAEDHRIVLSAAALYRDKGYLVAIQAMSQIGDGPPLTWLIAGGGEERALLEQEAQAAGVPARFVGSLPERDFAAAINAADIVLHPAPGELFPNIVAESMARERAVIGLDSGATPELIGRDARAGLLVPAENPPAMAAALRSLLMAPARAAELGVEARRRIRDHYPLDLMQRAYRSLVAEYLETPRGAPPTVTSPATP